MEEDNMEEDNKKWEPVSRERNEAIKNMLIKSERLDFLSWVINYFGGSTNLNRKTREEVLSQLENKNTPFALSLINEFKPRYNTFEELITEAKGFLTARKGK